VDFMLKRVVIKLSGEAIGSSTSETGYADDIIKDIVNQIKQVTQGGTQVALVIGGGNHWRGVQDHSGIDRVKSDQMGMLATIMNAIYLSEAFKREGQKSRVVTPMTFGNMSSVYDKDSALFWMNDGEVLINAAGLAHPMFSTDTVTALRAAELEADCILFAKNIDAVYDSDPKNNPKARKFKTLNYDTAITKRLQVADIAAMHLSNVERIPSYVFGLNKPQSIIQACAYPNTTLNGTYIYVDVEDDFYDN